MCMRRAYVGLSKRILVTMHTINRDNIVHMPLLVDVVVVYAGQRGQTIASSGGWGNESQHFLFLYNSSGELVR